MQYSRASASRLCLSTSGRLFALRSRACETSVPADLVVKVDCDRKNLRTLGKAGDLRVNASGERSYDHAA